VAVGEVEGGDGEREGKIGGEKFWGRKKMAEVFQTLDLNFFFFFFFFKKRLTWRGATSAGDGHLRYD